MSSLIRRFLVLFRLAGTGRRRASSVLKSRRGQTAVEYLLVTVALTIAFSSIYRVLQWYLTNQFRQGGEIILRMYKETPW